MTVILDERLGLPRGTRACLFDLDGVLTETATLHAKAWKQMFDAFLSARATSSGAPLAPFDIVHDYDQYVDGKPRNEGTRSFLAARNIRLPDGTPDDPATAQTLQGLGKRKNNLFIALISEQGVEPFPGSVRYVRAVKQAGLRTAVVSSSTNCVEVLAAARIAELFDARIDGVVASRQHLAGKPEPDTYLAAAKAVGVNPSQAAVFEDAQAGVAAGRAGRFGFVVGVDRVGQAAELRHSGADVVVDDLAALLETA